MKQFLFLGITAICLPFISCTKSSILETASNKSSPVVERSMVTITGSDYFSARAGDADAETWNRQSGQGADCAPPAKDCAVIYTSKFAGNQDFIDFDNAVTNGSISDFYQNGNGNQVISLSTSAFGDLLASSKTFYKVSQTSRNIYIFR